MGKGVSISLFCFIFFLWFDGIVVPLRLDGCITIEEV